MGNLVRSRTKLLWNTIDATSMTQSTTTLSIKDYNTFSAAQGVTCRKFKRSATYAGLKHAVLISPAFAYPTDTSQFEWFLNIKGRTDLRNGKINLMYLNDKSYQGYMGALASAVSGKIADADEVILIDSMVANINSDKNAPCVASRVGSTAPYLLLVAKSVDVKFDVQMDPKYGVFTQTGALQASGADGATSSAAATLTSAGSSWTTSAFVGMYGLITDTAAAQFGVYFAITANTGTVLTKTGNFASTETTLDFVVIGGASAYPRLTLQDVQRTFPIRAMNAGQGGENFPNGTVTNWTKWYFRIERSGIGGAPGLVAPNRNENFIEELEIYLPTSVAQTATVGEKKVYDWLTAMSYSDPHGDTTPWGLATS